LSFIIGIFGASGVGDGFQGKQQFQMSMEILYAQYVRKGFAPSPAAVTETGKQKTTINNLYPPMTLHQNKRYFWSFPAGWVRISMLRVFRQRAMWQNP